MPLALIAAVLLTNPAPIQEAPLRIKVLVINYDPKIASEGNKPLHQVLGWNDPKVLAQGYIDDIRDASGGFIRFEVKEWRDVNAFPVKKDGYVYKPDEFLAIFREKKKHHEPDGVDYVKVLDQNKVGQAIDSGKFDEVWFFNAPFFGFWESNMAGPGAFFINGDAYPNYHSKKRFAIMGFSYERGVAEMIHNLGHRTENHMKRVYGRWEANVKDPNPWERFSSYTKANGSASCGNCHFPPNGEKDYDYANEKFVESDADDWLKYPRLTGAKKMVNRETWGGPDYQRNYLKWWFTRLPKAPGTTPDGRQANWWKYIYDFNSYDERGLPLKR